MLYCNDRYCKECCTVTITTVTNRATETIATLMNRATVNDYSDCDK